MRNGPLIKTSSLRFESFHTMIKSAVDTATTHRSLSKSIAIRLQLGMMNLNYLVYDDLKIQYGWEVHSHLAKTTFDTAVSATEYRSVTMNNIRYKKDTVIITDINEDSVDEVYNSVCFNSHYGAYDVISRKMSDFIDYKSLTITTPCLLFEVDKQKYIVTKHVL